MLKTTMSSQVITVNEVLGAKVLAVNEVDDNEGGDESSDGSKRVKPKIWRSESQKSAKSRKLSKSRKSKGEKSKKPSKSRNLPNVNAKDSGPSFLSLEARSAFNYFRLDFTKALILWHFDPECHIQIETDTSGYAISNVLS